MLALYIISAIVGGGLILASALGALGSHAGFDHDAGGLEADSGLDHSFDHSADHSVDAHTIAQDAGVWLPFFSLRFWTYVFGGGGLAGLLLTLTNASAEPVTAIVSSGFGLVMGFIAAYTFRLLAKNETNTATLEADFVGALGKLTVGVRDAQPGKVRTSIRGDIIDMIAVSEPGRELPQGEEVVIVGVEGNTVRVAPRSDYLD